MAHKVFVTGDVIWFLVQSGGIYPCLFTEPTGPSLNVWHSSKVVSVYKQAEGLDAFELPPIR